MPKQTQSIINDFLLSGTQKLSIIHLPFGSWIIVGRLKILNCLGSTNKVSIKPIPIPLFVLKWPLIMLEGGILYWYKLSTKKIWSSGNKDGRYDIFVTLDFRYIPFPNKWQNSYFEKKALSWPENSNMRSNANVGTSVQPNNKLIISFDGNWKVERKMEFNNASWAILQTFAGTQCFLQWW